MSGIRWSWQPVREARGNRGAAMLFAIGILTLFALLGAAWFQGGRVALERQDLAESRLRAEAAALGGAEIGEARLAEAVRAGAPASAAGEWRVKLSNYGAALEGRGQWVAAAERPDRASEARVTVWEEDASAIPGVPPDATACYVVRSEGLAYRLAGDRPYGRARWAVERAYAMTQSGLQLVYTLSGGALPEERPAGTKEHGNG